MSTTESRGRNLVLASLTGVAVLADGGLAALGLLIWNAYRTDHLTAAEAATFVVLGVSAVAGAVVLLLTSIALARGRRGHGTAKLAYGLAWLRLFAVIIALLVVAARLGASAVVGLSETFGAILAAGDAALALGGTAVAVRRTG
jgi:hypothetical protein